MDANHPTGRETTVCSTTELTGECAPELSGFSEKIQYFPAFRVIDRIAKGAADVTAGQLIGREASEGVNGDP
jgi:hypothetical protein